MINRRTFSTLNFRTVCVVLIAAVCAMLVLYLSLLASEAALNNHYMSETSVTKRSAERVAELQDFVNREHLKSYDIDAIGEWTKNARYVYLEVYKGDMLVLIGGSWGADSYTSRNEGFDIDYENAEYHPIMFADGPAYVKLDDYSYEPVYTAATAGCIIVASAVFLLIILTYTNIITRRVINLSKSTKEISGGQLDAYINTAGADELSDLSRDVDFMRNSLIERINNEQEAWEANKALLTSISHDIRTPLTALVGYFDMIEKKQYNSEEELDAYLHACRNRANQLKELTDEMFRYFYVFGGKELNLDIQDYDAGVIIDQMLFESIIALEGSGFEVHMAKFKTPCCIRADAPNLKRVFDNIFSNILKYADSNQPVLIETAVENGVLFTRVKNHISRTAAKTESTQIGLKTCEKMMQQMGGEMKTYQTEDSFIAVIALAVVS